MNGWMEQWNWYVPGCVNVVVKLVPGWIGPESHSLSSLVVVWATGSSFVQVTGWPAATVMLAGEKANLVIETLAALVAAAAACAAGAGALAEAAGCIASGRAAFGCA